MSDAKKIEFESICEDILNNNNFKKLDHEIHHGITRYDHCIRVARYTYRISKSLNWKNYKEMTRAALLHDYFNNSELKEENSYQRLFDHPIIALKNANAEFKLNDMQKNIIKTHMFPVTKEMPKYKESWLVSLMDKAAAAYEMTHFKLSLKLSILVLFIYNIATVQK